MKGRTQCVMSDGFFTDKRLLIKDVPQASMFRPLLSFLHLLPLHSLLKDCLLDYHVYADLEIKPKFYFNCKLLLVKSVNEKIFYLLSIKGELFKLKVRNSTTQCMFVTNLRVLLRASRVMVGTKKWKIVIY